MAGGGTWHLYSSEANNTLSLAAGVIHLKNTRDGYSSNTFRETRIKLHHMPPLSTEQIIIILYKVCTKFIPPTNFIISEILMKQKNK